MKDVKINNIIENAISWLLNSGIQNGSGTHGTTGQSLNGSVNAWFDVGKNEYSYVYIEISGYALTTFLYLYEQEKKSVFLERAVAVGDWLISVQVENGAFPTALYREGNAAEWKPESLHTFDVGMVLNGLILLYRNTNEEKYLTAGIKAADWLLTCQKKDGSLYAQFDEKTGESCDSGRTWSTQPGSYHVKVAISLLNVFDVIKNEKYKKAALLLCDYALSKQQPDGQFLTYGNLNGTNLHPHIYSAEGLYVAGTYLDRKDYVEASHAAVQWALNHQKDGIVPRHKHGEVFNYNERVDILAQTLRMGSIFDLDQVKLTPIVSVIEGYQYMGGSKNQQGGITFGKQSHGASAPHINSWVTMFSLQALMLYNQGTLSSPFFLV